MQASFPLEVLWDGILTNLAKTPRPLKKEGETGSTVKASRRHKRTRSIYRRRDQKHAVWVPVQHRPCEPTLPPRRKRVQFLSKVEVVLFDPS